LRECRLCRTALADLEELLWEVERELRATVASETAAQRAEAHLTLEQEIYSAGKPTAFPVRWPAVYATAAALTMAVLAGYLSSWQTATQQPRQTVAANVPAQAVTGTAVPSSQTQLPQRQILAGANSFVSLADRATQDRAAAEPNVAPLLENTAGLASVTESGSREITAAAVSSAAAVSGNAGPAAAAAVGTPGRFELESPAPRNVQAAALADVISNEELRAPVQTLARVELNTPPMVLPSPEPVPAAVPLTVEGASALIEGHWILTRAGVWTEDIEPLWTSRGLEFSGTVESSARQRQISELLARAADSRTFSMDLRLRPQASAMAPVDAAVTLADDRRPAGGVVRNSLLSHFSDAARRSFQSPQPSMLEAEIDRYVTEVFRGQSRLRAHAYALKSLLEPLSREQLAALDPAVGKKFSELVRLHMKALGEDEAHIYDRLSEGLPRRFWTYRASERDLNTASDWREESAALLRDVLQLDSTLTALLSTPQTFVDISDSHLSCGELLYRIRNRVGRLRAAADFAR
jgi:hypothetical protein